MAQATATGNHRLALDNVGGDWANLSWFEFQGRFGAL
jgi:hypothetical protein